MSSAARISPTLRLNLSGESGDREIEASRFQAAIDMADYADRSGFGIVNVEEHHDAEIGWLGSPLVMAAAIAARTRQVRIRASALLITLYDPLRLAEDIAVIDNLSRGRFFFITGQGYRPSEYHMLDRDWDNRGAQTEYIIETLLKAWSGNPFEYKGQRVHVSPRPYTRPHPPFYYGGMSKIAARRAARLGVPFFPATSPSPDLEALYESEMQARGLEPVVGRHHGMTLLFIDDDPERAWTEIGPCLLKETRQYSSWTKPDVERSYEMGNGDIAELRAQRIFEILTPDEALTRARAAEGDLYMPILHPLAGGIPVDRAWRCMELFVEKVLKRL